MDTHAEHDSHSPAHIATRVRAGGMSAAIGAAFLLYFGFAGLMEPEATDMFSTSNLIFYHTARWGGVLMAGIALWLWTGHVVALLADGIIATLVGVLLVITGLGMGVGGGYMFQTLINFFCGYMFYSSGVRSGRDYFRLTKHASGPTVSEPQMHPMTDVEFRAATPEQEVQIEPIPNIETLVAETPAPLPEQVIDPDPNPDPSPDQNPEPDLSPPPPGGYLASFAKKDSNQDS